MSTDVRGRTLADWEVIREALRSVLNVIKVRGQYPPMHPAVARTDAHAAASLQRVLESQPELVVALIDGEFLVSERPQPELTEQLSGLAEILFARDVECIVFQPGITAAECSAFGEIFTAPAVPGELERTRDQSRLRLTHIMLRFAELKAGAGEGTGRAVGSSLTAVQEMWESVTRALAASAPIDQREVRSVAESIVARAMQREFVLEPHAFTPGVSDLAPHAANVATMTAAMALAEKLPRGTCVEATAAALLHDLGHLFLPRVIRGVPAPLLTDDRAKRAFKYHPFLGARALLVAECPALWVAAALEHHRGVDGGGYPALGSTAAPHALVRLVSLASFFDRKRTPADGPIDAPPAVLREAWSLADRYFDRSTLGLFVRALGAYPPGTTVELSDGRTATVTRANADNALRPEVTILDGPTAGKRADLRTLDAVERKHVASIVGAIAPQALGTLGARGGEAAAEEGRSDDDDDQVTIPTMIPASIAPEQAPVVVPPAPSSASSAPASARAGAYSWHSPPLANQGSGPPTRSEPSRVAAGVPKVLLGFAEIAKLPLEPRAAYLLSFMDGMLSFEEIAEASGVGHDEALRLVDELVRYGVVLLR